MMLLSRAAYRAQQRALALQATVLAESARLVASRVSPRLRRRRQAVEPAILRLLRRRFEELMARDLANADAGLYPRRLLFQIPLGAYARRLPALLLDLPRVVRRAHRGQTQDLPADVNLAAYPAYYRRNFHWQTDGYLSHRSADLYDVGVELLFGGTADVMRRQIIPPITRFLARRADGRRPRIVDIACGTGRTLRQLAIAHPDASYVGVDLSRYYLRVARRTLGATPVAFLEANGEELPIASASCDVATCVFTLHELPLDARRALLAEARRVLMPGGLLVVEDACQASDSPELAPVLEQFQRDLHEPYFRSYQAHDLSVLVSDAGFEVTAVEPHLVSKVVVAVARSAGEVPSGI